MNKILAFAALAVTLLTACSSDPNRLSKSEYEQLLQRTVVTARLSSLKLSFAISRAPAPRLIESRLTKIKSILADAADELDSAEPPKDAEEANTQLVSGLRDLSKTAERLASKPDFDLPRPLPGFADELVSSPAGVRLQAALAKLESAGYDVGT